MESVEASGRSIEDAILQALARLGRNRNEVEITVLQEPSRGQRGMGARDARVRVHVKAGYANRPPAAPEETGDILEDAELEVVDDYPSETDNIYGEGFETDLSTSGAPIYVMQEIPVAPLKDLLPPDASIE